MRLILAEDTAVAHAPLGDESPWAGAENQIISELQQGMAQWLPCRSYRCELSSPQPRSSDAQAASLCPPLLKKEHQMCLGTQRSPSHSWD